MKITQECGQKWYRLSSWYSRYPKKTHYAKFRKLPGGFAFGPIMVFLRKV